MKKSMYQKNLYLLVEGVDDFRFFSALGEKIFPPHLKTFPVEYSQKEPANLNKRIDGFNSYPLDDYIFFADLDRHKNISSAKTVKLKKSEN